MNKPQVVKLITGWLVLVCFGTFAPAFGANETELHQHIQEQVQSDEQLEGAEVRITVQGSDVVLSGTVRLYSQKMRYEQIIWQTPGVMDVDNEIRVRPHRPIADRDIQSQILTIKHKYQRFQASVIQATVEKGEVRVVGSFRDASDVLFFKHRIAEIEGVIRTIIDVQYTV